MPSTADAVAREAAWLNSYGDTLPALSVAQGGPFEVIQAYRPRVLQPRKTGIYVRRPEFEVERFANVRQMYHYEFHTRIVWPLSNSTGSEELENANFDAAVDLVLQRILGLLLDKTHGGRFLAVAEKPSFVKWVEEDPATTFPNNAGFVGTFVYHADDQEVPG